MNRRFKKYLGDRHALEDALPFVAVYEEKAKPLLDFLDKEADTEDPLDRETFLLLLDQAAGEPLGRAKREEILDLLLVYTSNLSKVGVVGLIRDALRAIARDSSRRPVIPDMSDPTTRSLLRGMLP